MNCSSLLTIRLRDMLTNTEIETIVERIVARMQPQKVIIFGSYAKGTATIKSDLDIFIIKETELPPANRAVTLMPLLASILNRVDVHVYTPEEVEAYREEPFSFVNSVFKSGKTVFEK
jgi:predicted nucleotidyltransferase